MEENNQKQSEKDLKKAVFEQISEKHIEPFSKLSFTRHEALVWALWLLSVAVGAIAMAVIFYVTTHQQYSLYEATHENVTTFLIDIMPSLWILAFAAMAGSAIYNLKHTKRGYKYPVWQILLSSLVLSVALGSLFQLFGFGYWVDHELGERVQSYRSQERMELDLWQQPSQGRLVGVISDDETFVDQSGEEWFIETVELTPREMEILKQGDPVRILGTSTEEGRFSLCGVFPLYPPGKVSRNEIREQKEQFLSKVRSMPGASESGSDLKTDKCPSVPVVQRLKNRP